jgi:hypothetical protein
MIIFLLLGWLLIDGAFFLTHCGAYFLSFLFDSDLFSGLPAQMETTSKTSAPNPKTRIDSIAIPFSRPVNYDAS